MLLELIFINIVIQSEMQDDVRFNLLILLLNIVALVNFTYPPRNYCLAVFMLVAMAPVPLSVKTKMRLISVLSVIGSFIENPHISQMFGTLALGLTVNAAYELDLPEGPSAINTAICVSQILSFWTKQYLQKDSLNKDITLMIFTLPNLFLSYDCERSERKKLFLINGFLEERWEYSFGLILGIYTTSLTSLEKHLKFFFISFILFLQSQFNVGTVAVLLCFARGVLIYNESVHASQKYFLGLFLIFRIFLEEYLIDFMFIGYLVIGVILYQQHHHGGKANSRGSKKKEQKQIKEPLIEMIKFNRHHSKG